MTLNVADSGAFAPRSTDEHSGQESRADASLPGPARCRILVCARPVSTAGEADLHVGEIDSDCDW